MSNERVQISGYALEATGWGKEGFRWAKGWSELTYDGYRWMYMFAPECILEKENGGIKIIWIKVEYMDEIKKF